MSRYNPVLVVDERRFLRHGGCYARTSHAACAMMLEMRREKHQLDSVWIDVDSETGQSAVRELISMSSEGERLQVTVVNLYGANQESAVLLRAGGYTVCELAIDEYVTSDGSANISFAGR
jgi:hypothetical protein